MPWSVIFKSWPSLVFLRVTLTPIPENSHHTEDCFAELHIRHCRELKGDYQEALYSLYWQNYYDTVCSPASQSNIQHQWTWNHSKNAWRMKLQILVYIFFQFAYIMLPYFYTFYKTFFKPYIFVALNTLHLLQHFIDNLNNPEVSKVYGDFRHQILINFITLEINEPLFFFFSFFLINFLLKCHKQLKFERIYSRKLNAIKIYCFVETETLQKSEYSLNHCLYSSEDQNQILKC